MEDLFEKEIEARKAADEQVETEQSSLEPGDFCVRYAHGLAIYSEILDAATLSLRGRRLEDLDEDEREEYEFVRTSYQDEHMRNYRFTRSYSCVCPQGELGDIHVSTVSRCLTHEEFIAAKNNGWQ